MLTSMRSSTITASGIEDVLLSVCGPGTGQSPTPRTSPRCFSSPADDTTCISQFSVLSCWCLIANTFAWQAGTQRFTFLTECPIILYLLHCNLKIAATWQQAGLQVQRSNAKPQTCYQCRLQSPFSICRDCIVARRL